MVEVEIISPKDRKRALKCCDCEMVYSVKDYDILFKNEKLIYFKFKPKGEKRKKTYFHLCLLSAIYYSYPFDEIPLKIIDSDYEYHCRYFAVDEDNEDDFLSGLGDIFKK